MIKCKIKIERILFPKGKTETELGEYCILGVKLIKNFSKEKIETHILFNTFSLKGKIGIVKIGDELTITMNKLEKNKYGTTYQLLNVCAEINEDNPEELKSFYKLLFGSKIANTLGADKKYFQMLKNKETDNLLNIKGIGKVVLERAYKKLESYAGFNRALTVLSPLGLTKNQIEKICAYTKDENTAIDICMKNPYLLVNKISGLGFKTIDEIALKSCKNIDQLTRVSAAILASLMEEGENGKSYLTISQLRNLVSYKLTNDIDGFDSCLKKLATNKEILTNKNFSMFTLKKFYDLERKIYEEICRIHKSDNKIKVPGNWLEILRELEEEQGWNYSEEQVKAIELMLNENLVIVSGKAGTGKTTVVKAVCKILNKYSISMCCLAAKAAQRLTEVTGYRASTIHRLLGIGSQVDTGFLFEDIIIVDEASMVNGPLFLKLLNKLKSGTKLIILGDTGQLTAIGSCSVFADLLESNWLNIVEFNEIHRQAKKSAIITKSIDIRNQKSIVPNGFTGVKTFGELQDLDVNITDDVLKETIMTFVDYMTKENNLMEVQVITGLKNRGEVCTKTINNQLQNIFNPKISKCFKGGDLSDIYVGDKVINTVNNYNSKNIYNDNIPVFNGSIGIVKSVEDNKAIIDFAGIGEVVFQKDKFKNINLAYAITVHSSQGSQWNRVICCFNMAQYTLLNVEIIYTAMTRGITKTALISEMKALQKSTKTVEQNLKQTFLREFVRKI